MGGGCRAVASSFFSLSLFPQTFCKQIRGHEGWGGGGKGVCVCVRATGSGGKHSHKRTYRHLSTRGRKYTDTHIYMYIQRLTHRKTGSKLRRSTQASSHRACRTEGAATVQTACFSPLPPSLFLSLTHAPRAHPTTNKSANRRINTRKNKASYPPPCFPLPFPQGAS